MRVHVGHKLESSSRLLKERQVVVVNIIFAKTLLKRACQIHSFWTMTINGMTTVATEDRGIIKFP